MSSTDEAAGEKTREAAPENSSGTASPNEPLESEKRRVEPFGKARAILVSTMIVSTQLLQVSAQCPISTWRF